MPLARPNAQRRTSPRIAWAALAALTLSACGAPTRQTFDLSGLPGDRTGALASAPRNGSARVSIEEPTAVAPFGGERIVIRTEDGGVAFLADAQWADRATRLMQRRLIGAFSSSGLAAALPAGPVEAALAFDVRRFEIDAARGVAVVELMATLRDDRSGQRRAAQIFRGEAPAPHTKDGAAALALEAALDAATGRLIAWTRARL